MFAIGKGSKIYWLRDRDTRIWPRNSHTNTWHSIDSFRYRRTSYIAFSHFRLRLVSVNAGCFINLLSPRQNGRHFPDNIFECIFSNENVWISIKVLLKFVPEGVINHIAALVQIMARRQDIIWAMMDSLLTFICVNRPQWIKPPLKSESVMW